VRFEPWCLRRKNLHAGDTKASTRGLGFHPSDRSFPRGKTEVMGEGRRLSSARRSATGYRITIESEYSLDLSVKRDGRFLPRLDSWLLDGPDGDEKELASRILETCAAHRLPAGSLRQIGDLLQAEILLVEKGFLIVRAPSPSARQVVVAEAGAGSILHAPGERERVHALTDSWVTVLPRAPLDDLLAIPSVARMLFRALMAAVRLKQDATSHFANVHHVDRVRLKLLQLAEEFGRVSPEGIRLEVPLTHDLLAEMVGSARETVTRCLDELQRSGFVVRDGHSYRLLISPNELDAQG
jgi:CRP/FNR family transcriptional regulator, cyclic AMP receptor protein